MILTDIKIYDGVLLHKRFAYKYFRNKCLPIGNIISFRAPAKVETEGLIDQEDSLNKDFIYSEDMIHFLYEIPLITEGFGAISYQRMFNSIIANILNKYIDAPIEVDGDDLMVNKEFTQGGVTQQKGKCSVSIVHVKDSAALGHTGINVTAGKHAPAFAYSTKLTDIECQNFMSDVINAFYQINDDIFIASTKIISH
jgi:hypothetical protein